MVRRARERVRVVCAAEPEPGRAGDKPDKPGQMTRGQAPRPRGGCGGAELRGLFRKASRHRGCELHAGRRVLRDLGTEDRLNK